MDRYDVLIVGAGSAGCALAARLSERPERRVLLIEAGPHFRTLDDFPTELAQARSLGGAMPGHPNNWSFVGTILPDKTYPLARGKVVGGSSTVNGVYFVRSRPADHDAWVTDGLSEWSTEKLLPHYRRAETDLDLVGDQHGKDGPLPIRRNSDAEMRPVSKAFVGACVAAGHPEEPDKNDSTSTSGVGPVPQNCVDGRRINTAVAYLTACSARPNFTLMPDTMVERVIIRDGVAVGVETRQGGELRTHEADEIILSAGGIKSPHLLQLSGIGPSAILEEHGIPLVRDLPVGRFVQDHPTVSVSFQVKDGEESEAAARTSAIQVCLNHSSPDPDAAEDLQISCMSASFERSMRTGKYETGWRSRIPSWASHPFRTLRALVGLSAKVVLSQLATQNQLSLGCHLQLPHSVGQIDLRSASPSDHPHIDLNYLSDPRDLPRIRYNVRTALQLLRSPQFEALGVTVTAPTPEDTSSDSALDSWIVTNLGTAMHTSCGARMGTDERTSVVDQYGRVHGIQGLRVADLSILPTIPRRSPHATAVMIGERVASFLP